MRRQLAGIVGSIHKVAGPHGAIGVAGSGSSFTSISSPMTVGSESNRVMAAIFFGQTNISTGGPASGAFAVSASSDDATQNTSTGIMSPLTNTSVICNSNNEMAFRFLFSGTGPPQGATITSAHITFTAAATIAAGQTVRFFAQNTDGTGTFTSADFNITDRPKTSAFVDWTTPAFTSEQTYDTPSLITPIQAIVNRVGWDEESLVIIAQRPSGTANVGMRTWDLSPTAAAVLHLAWTTSGTAFSAAGALPTSVQLIGSSTQNFTFRKRATSFDGNNSIVLALWTLNNPNSGAGTLTASGYDSAATEAAGMLAFYVSNAKPSVPEPMREDKAVVAPSTSREFTFFDVPPGAFAFSAFASPEPSELTPGGVQIGILDLLAGSTTRGSCGFFPASPERISRLISWNSETAFSKFSMIGAAFHPVDTDFFPGFASFGSLNAHYEDEIDETDGNVDVWNAVNEGAGSLSGTLFNRPQTGAEINLVRPALNFISSNPSFLTSAFSAPQTGTVFAVIRPDVVENNPLIMSMGGIFQGTPGVELFLTNTGFVRCRVSGGTGAAQAISSGASINAGTTAIVYGSWDVGGSINTVVANWHLGIEGSAGTVGVGSIGGTTMRVGQTGSAVFDGAMALLVYYNDRLSNGNIAAIMNELVTRYTT